MFTWNLNHFHHKHTKLNKMAMNNWSTDERCRWGQKAWSPNSTFWTFSGCSVFRAGHVLWTLLIKLHFVTWQLFIDRLPSLHVYKKLNVTPRCHSPLPPPSKQDDQLHEQFRTIDAIDRYAWNRSLTRKFQ